MEYKRFTDKRKPLVSVLAATEAYWKLAEIEDKIENGTLIELPCKVGDTAYCVVETYNKGCKGWKIRDVKVDNIGVNLNNDFITDIGEYNPCYMVYGIDIFATREEAEKRLEELKKNEHKSKV